MAKHDDDLPGEFEIEISDLDQPGDSASRGRVPGLRLTRKQRRVSLALTAGLFLLACSLLVASTPDVRGLVARIFMRPAPTAGASGLHLYLESNPSWGQFQLDGARLARLPLIGQDAPLNLAPGTHQLIWRVAPFQTRVCLLIVVNTSTVTGSCARDPEVTMAYITSTSALIISFFASLNDLSGSQRTALVRQMQQALATYGGSETVYPGEIYAVSEQEIRAHYSLCPIVVRITLCYARATQPLIASLTIQSDTGSSTTDPCLVSQICYLNHLDCRLLCPDLPLIFSGQIAEGWDVLVPARLLWSYATLAGQVIARDQPDTALRGVPDYRLLSLHITRAEQGWQLALFASPVASNYTDPLCGQAAQDTTELVNTLSNDDQGIAIVQWSDQQSHLAPGCLEVTEPAPGPFATPTPTPDAQQSQPAYCLFRFGVILAVNSTAHRLWPYLPLADTYEQGLAQHLYSLLPL